MSPQTIAAILGAICGVLAAVPTSLIVIHILTKRRHPRSKSLAVIRHEREKRTLQELSK